MSKEKKVSLKFRDAELSEGAGFVSVSFERDRPAIAALFSEYDEAYEQDFNDQIKTVLEMEQGLSISEGQKNATKALYLGVDDMNLQLNIVSFRFSKVGLSSPLVTKVKDKLSRGDVEGACTDVESLCKYMEDNTALLQSKGMKSDYPSALKTKSFKLRDLNQEQNKLMNAGKNVSFDKNVEYAKLFGFIKDICKAGKIVFDGTVTEDEYTITRLIKRMRAPKRKKKEEEQE